MNKQVRETKAAQAIRATVILNPKGKHVATVHAHYSDAGIVTVDIWHTEHGLTYQGRATGYGYDKYAAALHGAVIDGHKLYDHSSSVELDPDAPAALLRLWRRYQNPTTPLHTRTAINTTLNDRYGVTLHNWSADTGRHTSAHYASTLERLELLGYHVINAI